jgi:hypothetical protein
MHAFFHQWPDQDPDPVSCEGDFEIMIEEMLGVRAIEFGPGPRGDGVRDAFPLALKVTVNMSRKDAGNPVLFEQSLEAPGALRRQAVMVFAAPGVIEGHMEENQTGLVVPGFL